MHAWVYVVVMQVLHVTVIRTCAHGNGHCMVMQTVIERSPERCENNKTLKTKGSTECATMYACK